MKQLLVFKKAQLDKDKKLSKLLLYNIERELNETLLKKDLVFNLEKLNAIEQLHLLKEFNAYIDFDKSSEYILAIHEFLFLRDQIQNSINANLFKKYKKSDIIAMISRNDYSDYLEIDSNYSLNSISIDDLIKLDTSKNVNHYLSAPFLYSLFNLHGDAEYIFVIVNSLMILQVNGINYDFSYNPPRGGIVTLVSHKIKF